MAQIVNRLESALPLLQLDEKGNLISWNSNLQLLRFLDHYLNPRMHTTETGAGYTTWYFCITNASIHTSIVSSQDEVNRITAYCRKLDVSLASFEFSIGNSPNLLPRISGEKYDIAFIDGAHRFPFPIVDWFYCAELLKQGGLMFIDDTDIISCHILVKFMLNDPKWEKLETRENFAIFQKLGGHDLLGDWVHQPFSSTKICRPFDVFKLFLPSVNRLTNAPQKKKNALRERCV